MSTTPNLLISHIAASQNQKEVTANTAFDDFDEALCSKTSEAMTDTNFTVPQADFLTNMVLVFTGNLTATRTVTLPANKKPFVISNQTANTGSLSSIGLTIKVGSGAQTQFVPNDGLYYIFWNDGSNSIWTLRSTNVKQAPITLQHYTVASLPVTGTEGDVAFATNGLKSFETTGNGTGVPVYFSQSNPSIGPVWRVFRDDSQVLS